MKAVGYVKSLPIEDPRSLMDLELPKPVARGRDILVRVCAVSVNPRDVKSRMTTQGTDDAPVVLGFDASGVVESVGDDVSLFQPGDEVFYAGVVGRQGSNAEFQLVDERIVGRKPASVDHATAASLPLTALTAYEMLFDRLAIERNAENAPSLLVLGGAGGVPSCAIQLARHAGITVIATASRPESEKWVRELGAQYVIDHSDSLDKQVKQLGIGNIDYVFSTHTSARAWGEIARLIAPQGRLGLIDDPEPLDLRVFKPKCVSIHWEAMFTRALFQTLDMIRQHEILNEIADMVDAKQLRAAVSRNLGTINASNLRKAHELIESDKTVGKIVLAEFAGDDI